MQPINEKNAVEVARTVKDTPILSAGSVRRSSSIKEFAAAMVNVQKEIEDPVKNKSAAAGARGSYRYADLPAVLDVARPALARNGFSILQLPCELDGEPALTTLLLHTSGEWVETTTKIRAADPRPQSIGSAQSYARRYALLALCGIAADDDDDGKVASQKPQPQQQSSAARASGAPNPPPHDAVTTDWGRDFAAQVDAASSREHGTKLWGIYESESKLGKVNSADKLLIDGAFKRFSQRVPKQTPPQQPQGVKS